MSQENLFTAGKVLPKRIESEMQESYINYAMSVIVARALPDVRDGLKPVHRRILYAMDESGMSPGKAYRKSARLVGDVLGKYHPHGDSSVYDATVRLAQDFSSRYPMVDGHGNFGSIDGDSAAAMRYTEVRMARIAEEMLKDLEKDTVDFGPNYDESMKEPLVLPARIPNLLVNGSSGIAVGMATNIPPHNLGEVVDGVVAMIDNPEITVDELMEYVHGPDFPTGAQILGRTGIRNAYRNGKGSVIMRAKARFEDMSGGKTQIIVTEIPYMVNKARLIENIANLVRDKVIDGITDLRDESDREGMRIVIELRRDAYPEIILNQLYKHTALQSTFGVNTLALVDGKPQVLNLQQVLFHYLNHQKEVIIRRTQFDLNKALDKAHILEGLKIALDHLDEVITTIRNAPTAEVAKEGLMSKFSLSERQSQAILDLRLQRLTGLERQKIEDDLKNTMEIIADLRSILADETKIYGIIREDLLEVKRRFGDKRRSEITENVAELDIEDLIPDEEAVITLTRGGYIKRTPMATYRSQRRGGVGVQGMTTKAEDLIEHLYIATTHSTLLFFTSLGRVYPLKAYEIPEAGRNAKGSAMPNLITLEKEETVTAIIPVREFNEEDFLFMSTRGGVVKKTKLNNFAKVRRTGIIAINLDDGDSLIGVKRIGAEDNIFIATRNGLAIQFKADAIRELGRTARGVRGIKLRLGDELVAMDAVESEETEVLTVSANGYGKRTQVSEYREQGRGGKGVINLKVTDKTGPVVGSRIVLPEQDLMLISTEGKVIRMDMDAISVIGRNAQGVKLMRMGGDEQIAALAAVNKAKDEDE
jgi:DNA gyrase, A subunit